jgi:hypothetical protein
MVLSWPHEIDSVARTPKVEPEELLLLPKRYH